MAILKDSFYHITSLNHTDNTIIAALQFQPDHAIFGGHFSGQPVVPGACMLQMVKEVLNDTLNVNYHLKKAGNLKFIAPVDPRMVDDAEIKITYKSIDTGLQLTAVLNVNGVVCFKMQGVFVEFV